MATTCKNMKSYLEAKDLDDLVYLNTNYTDLMEQLNLGIES